VSAAKTHHLFISHAWPYADYSRLVAMLNRADDFRWKNYSVDRERPFPEMSNKRLREAIRGQIKPASAVVFIAGMEIHRRIWVQQELDIALEEFSKPIIAVVPRGKVRVPVIFQECADEVVRWSSNSIISAIERHST